MGLAEQFGVVIETEGHTGGDVVEGDSGVFREGEGAGDEEGAGQYGRHEAGEENGAAGAEVSGEVEREERGVGPEEDNEGRAETVLGHPVPGQREVDEEGEGEHDPEHAFLSAATLHFPQGKTGPDHPQRN